MTDTALVGGICVDIRKSMSRFVDAYNQSDVFDIAETIDTTLLEPLRNVSNIQLLNDSEQYEHEGQEAAVSSSEFSYDMLKRFRRFYLDHHSLDPESNSAPAGT